MGPNHTVNTSKISQKHLRLELHLPRTVRWMFHLAVGVINTSSGTFEKRKIVISCASTILSQFAWIIIFKKSILLGTNIYNSTIYMVKSSESACIFINPFFKVKFWTFVCNSVMDHITCLIQYKLLKVHSIFSNLILILSGFQGNPAIYQLK